MRAVRFQNVRMQDVSNPIIIDQFYCDSPKSCQNQVFFSIFMFSIDNVLLGEGNK